MTLRKLDPPYLWRCLAHKAFHRVPDRFDRGCTMVQFRRSAPVSGASNVERLGAVTDGVIYVATGERHVAEALVSARSLKTHMPDLTVTLYTDRKVDDAAVDDVVAFAGDGYLSRIPGL